MKNTTLSRTEIFAKLAALPSAVQGTICEDHRTLADGSTAVYHNLQYWHNGKNHTIRIPEEKLPEFREAVKNGKMARDILADLTRVDAASILSSASPLKKKSKKSRSSTRPASAN